MGSMTWPGGVGSLHDGTMAKRRWLNRARVAASGLALVEGLGGSGRADAIEWRPGGSLGAFIGYRFGGGYESGFGFGLEAHGVFIDRTNDCAGQRQLYAGAVTRLEFSGWKTTRLTLGPAFGFTRPEFGYGAEAGVVLGRGVGLAPHVGAEVTGAGTLNARASYVIARDGQIAGGLRFPWLLGSCPVAGRPLRRDDRRAPLAGAVLAALPGAGGDGARTASVGAARVWTDRARLEWASVPAFCELAEQLVVSGAPLALVERAREAAADELRHAVMAATAAGALARTGSISLDPPVPDRRPPAPGREGIVRLAMESFVDGCLGEGAAAVVAAEEADAAEGQVLRETQRTIAHDEARHAELAWAILEWAALADPHVVLPALRVVASHESTVHGEDVSEGGMERFGILDTGRSAAVRESHQRTVRARLHGRLGI